MTTNTQTKRRHEFLLELRELTLKYGISIGGCGCCGSPWLDENAAISDTRAGYVETEGFDLKWIEPSDKLYWKKYSSGIVKPAEETKLA